ncbi:MAG: hypothetical protein V7691_08155 [Galbibacter orientalis]|uniref:hypothetical protein n=1 Tax=Galbibacter orientalis TaxID=453852 RepID=UPI0030039C16
MSTIFKEHIIPKLNIKSFKGAEIKALLQILKLMHATDNEIYKNAKKDFDTNTTTPNFTNNLSQSIYLHPKIYANERQGLKFVESWLPLLENGFYPDKKSTRKLLEFLYFNLSYFQSEDTSEIEKIQIFKVLKLLIQSKSEASLPVACFLIHRIFDIRDVLNSDFIIQHCLKHQLLTEGYTIKNTDLSISTIPFAIDKHFITHFFDGNWHLFITKFHQLLPVGLVYAPSAYDLMSSWFSFDLASFYESHQEMAIFANQALKERIIWGETKSLELLNIQTKNGNYPLINVLAKKTWDAGDVLLFNNRDKNIPQQQLDSCYLNFLDWLLVDAGSNLNSEAFTGYGIKILSECTAEALPLECIPFWFHKCHPKTSHKNQRELLNPIFTKLLLETTHATLPAMRFEGADFQVKGTFLISEIFKTENNLKEWLEDFKKEGIKNPLNQFLIRIYYDANEELTLIYTKEEQEYLQLYLIELAYSSRYVSDSIRKKNLPILVKTLAKLCAEPVNFSRVNEIWALKNIDVCIIDICNNFAREHYINEDSPLNLNLIQAWFNYLGDYFYSLTKEAVWVSEALTTQGLRTANFFNIEKEDVSYFLERLINRIIDFHKRCKLKEETNPIFNNISKQIELYLTDFLIALKEEKLNINTINYLYNYCKSDGAGLIKQSKLITAINNLHQFHFKEELSTETDYEVSQLPVSKVEIEIVEINKKYVDAVLHNLENYKEEGCDTQILTGLYEKIDDFKIWINCDKTGIETRFSQALYKTLLDTNLTPKTDLKTYGTLCRNLFVYLVKGTKMSDSYVMGLKAMTKSGVYPEHITANLRQVVKDLNV